MILDPIDQNIRNQGFNFVPFDRYLAEGFQPKTLDMSGGISTLPMSSFMAPPILNINQGGGEGGGGGGITAGPVDQGLMTADFAPDQSMTGTMGMTEEEEDAINAMKNPGFTGKQIGMLGLQAVFNPLGAIINTYRTQQKNRAAALEQAQAAATAARAAENEAAGTGGYQAGYSDDFMTGGGGGTDAGQEASSPGSSGPGGSDTMGSFMDGGIVDLLDIYD
jgi:hypothetical protein